MSHRIATIARYTALEALRTRLPVLAAVVIGALFAASFFIREIAITDSARFQTSFYAATVRFAMVFIAALHVVGSVSREFQDKGLDMVLALDLPRAHYVIGRLMGFLSIALALALVAALPLAGLSHWASALQWSASLAAELAVIVALSVFCVLTFNQLMPAASFVLAFYLLGRVITAVRLIGGNPVAGADALSHQVMRWLVETLALLVPPLDAWTRTAWLVDAAAPWSALGAIAAHGGLLIVILAAAAVFDLSRKNF
jgi:ABC-type transport system involved in multi-copper enzyme maturation permease subunit